MAERTRKYDDAALSFASAVPFAGWGANAAKWGRKALKLPVKEAKLLGVNLAARAACNATWKQAAQGYAAHALKGAATAVVNDAVAQGVGLAVGKQDDWSWGRTLSAGALGSAVSMASYRLSKVCFAAGTPLLTPDGHKNIEDFKVGDQILSRNEFDVEGPVEVKCVEEVFVRQGRILHVHVGGQVIQTTAEHPFFVRGKGWTAAGALGIGDLLASHDGQWIPVRDLLDTGEVETVYNLRVSKWHTYFVGRAEWGFSTWAHNADCGTWNQFQQLTRGQFGSRRDAANAWQSLKSNAAKAETVITSLYREALARLERRGPTPLVAGARADEITKRWLRIHGNRVGLGDLQFDVRRNYPNGGARGAEVDVVLAACWLRIEA